MKRADGALVAIEVHTIPRTVPAGHIPWDLQPGTMMTNANVMAVVQTANGQELTLEYMGNTQKILVPAGTPIGTTMPADSSTVSRLRMARRRRTFCGCNELSSPALTPMGKPPRKARRMPDDLRCTS